MKQIDERRTRARCLVELFDDDITEIRRDVVQRCEDAMFSDQDSVSHKPRELLWRKGYYDTISLAKRFIHQHWKSQSALESRHNNYVTAPALDGTDKLCLFIEEGMLRLKKMVIRIDQDYDLDLKYIVDFSLFENGEVAIPVEHEVVPINKKITSLEIINFALESIHAIIVSLGDLHRYYLDFGLNKQFDADVTAELTARFYEAAFKLNPKQGMPQNQLGTLWIGRNFNLDSVYHYLYSLVCPKPFEMSEDNVIKIFNQGAVYLENLVMPDDYTVTLQDFIARFLLIVDIFFFDKNVPTLNDLCRFLLCDLKTLLGQRGVFTQDILFKFTSILFFCMNKLKRSNSPKVFQLNAFLAAICDQFTENCNANFDAFFQEHYKENADYKERYQQLYDIYNEERINTIQPEMLDKESIMSKKDKRTCQNIILDDAKMNGLSGTSSAEGTSSPHEAGDSDKNGLSGSRQGRQGKSKGSIDYDNGKKRAPKYRRRRRRSTYSSDSDLTSNFDSDSEKSEVDESDFSYEDSDDDTDDDGEHYEEEPATPNKYHVDRRSSTAIDEDNDSDIVIEEETVVLVGRNKDNGSVLKSESTQESGHGDLIGQLDELCIVDANGKQEDVGPKRERNRQKLGSVKYSPNLLLRFVDGEPTIRALKLLFDWLMDHKEIVWECFQSNPDFLHKIMVLLNTVNLDIFTRRVFFKRQLLTVNGLRDDIKSLFEVRGKLPISEDMHMKHFSEFARAQAGLDWELPVQMYVTPMEENLMRIVKLKNFGFFICDRKKFGYVFRNCEFEEINLETMREKKKAKRSERRGGRKPEANGGRVRKGQPGIGNKQNGDKLQKRRGRMEESSGQPRRGRGLLRDEGNGDAKTQKEMILSKEKEMLRKGELMGKLWLRNEVKNLESKVKLHCKLIKVDSKSNIHFTIISFRHETQKE